MKILTFEFSFSLIDNLERCNIFCENYYVPNIDDLIIEDNTNTIAVVDLCKIEVSELLKLKTKLTKKRIPIMGIVDFTKDNKKTELCSHLITTSYTSKGRRNIKKLTQDIYLKIFEIFGKNDWIQIKTLPDLYIHQWAQMLKYEDRLYQLRPTHWRILLQLSLTPNKLYTIPQLIYHAFPINKEPVSLNSVQSSLSALKKFCEKEIGHTLINTLWTKPAIIQLSTNSNTPININQPNYPTIKINEKDIKVLYDKLCTLIRKQARMELTALKNTIQGDLSAKQRFFKKYLNPPKFTMRHFIHLLRSIEVLNG